MKWQPCGYYYCIKLKLLCETLYKCHHLFRLLFLKRFSINCQLKYTFLTTVIYIQNATKTPIKYTHGTECYMDTHVQHFCLFLFYFCFSLSFSLFCLFVCFLFVFCLFLFFFALISFPSFLFQCF